MRKLSVIIPAYQAGQHLRTCVESVLQNDIDLAVLIVNDGSTDGTEWLCKQLSEEYSNVIYWTKNHEGPGAAREYAINRADSEYIAFVDADDYLDPHAYDSIFSCMEEDCDILEFGYRTTEPSGRMIREYPFLNKSLTDEDCGSAFAKHTDTTNYLVNKVYKKALFHTVEFPRLYAGEDASVLAQLFVYAKKYRACEGIYYNYVQTPDSLCRKPFSIKRLDNLTASRFVDGFYSRCAPQLVKYSRQKICSAAAILYCQIRASHIEDAAGLCDKMVRAYKNVRESEGIFKLVSYGPLRRRLFLLLFDISPPLCSFVFSGRIAKQ